MDPSAVDFVMHRSPSEPSRLLSDTMPQHHSPCPAMRAAAAAAATSSEQQHQGQGLGASSRMSGRPHYDPVHGSTSSSGSWWQQPQPQQHQYSHQQQAMPHLGWPPALYPPFARTTGPLYAPNFPPVPSPGASNPSTGTSSQIPPRMHNHEHYGGHAHPLSQMHSPPTFHHPPTIPSLNRIGGSAPAHHSQGFSTQGSNSDSHVPRTTGLPALHPFSPMAQNQQTSHGTQTFGNSGSSDMDAALRTRPDTGEQLRGNTEASRFPHEDARVTMGYRRHQQPPPAHQPSSPPLGDLPVMQSPPTHSRRPRFQPSSSEPSSDEDTDPEHDVQTLRFLEAVASNNGMGYMPAYMGSEERIRAQQLLRGTVSGKRVASKSALASLQSVEVSELTDNERTCIICYNEFGVENPEGINEAPLRLPKCKHIFGDHCIKKWFEESDSCPYCRDKVPSEPQFQHSHPRSHQAMMHIVRQQHGFGGMSQALGGHRQARGEPGSQNRAGDPGRVTGLNFAELYEQPPVFRRSDGSSFRSTWQTSPGRRSPSADFNDSRRRTRARHGSFRGSPPSTRPMSYTATSGGPSPPFARQYNSSLGRHSMQFSSASPRTRPLDTPAFELNTPPAFPGADVAGHHPPRGSTEVSNNGTYPLRSDWRSPWGYQTPDMDEGPDSRPPFQQSP